MSVTRLSSAGMAAIRAGWKTQIRFIVHTQPILRADGPSCWMGWSASEAVMRQDILRHCPGGRAGDWITALSSGKDEPALNLKIMGVELRLLHDITGPEIVATCGLDPDEACGRESGWEIAAFRDYWLRTHSSASWDANPWVYAITFSLLNEELNLSSPKPQPAIYSLP
jgi:hypothetical protein